MLREEGKVKGGGEERNIPRNVVGYTRRIEGKRRGGQGAAIRNRQMREEGKPMGIVGHFLDTL